MIHAEMAMPHRFDPPGIDAGCAVDAFQLGAVADIDAGRADMDALAAIDTIAGLVCLPAT